MDENHYERGENVISPFCSVDGLKVKAKILAKRLDPERTVSLTRHQDATIRCIGRERNDVFRHREPALPIFPGEVDGEGQITFQHEREVRVLSDFLPHVSIESIETFVETWKLVDWKRSTKPKGNSTSKSPPRRSMSSRVAEPHRSALDRPLGVTTTRPLPCFDENERATICEIVLPSPDGLFMPPTLDVAVERANGLRALFPKSSESWSLQLTARIFGFHDWQHFEQTFELRKRSPFDEELEPDALCTRLDWQTRALELLLQRNKVVASDIRAAWRPTSQSDALYIGPPFDDRKDERIAVESCTKRLQGRLTVRGMRPNNHSAPEAIQ
ncbi:MULTISPECIES: hypothetical protein [unclassified Caballeronia]|uniref:hypothetical protein n=1 Tax=unclassified Caballeronia TaxID=2646786 RepID=UPI00202847C4|nr:MULTISPECIES: hypothetical protein [unclassified Caballeronia]MDR5768100.1 hypothetical protein [Caballeronia sp. LZ028]